MDKHWLRVWIGCDDRAGVGGWVGHCRAVQRHCSSHRYVQWKYVTPRDVVVHYGRVWKAGGGVGGEVMFIQPYIR